MRCAVMTTRHIAPQITSHIGRRILLIRGRKVMLDADPAELYGVPTKRLNEQVKRNARRLPDDFAVRVTKARKQRWSQIATTWRASSFPLRYRRYPERKMISG